MFSSVFKNQFSHPIYFNFDSDLLAFDSKNTAELFIDLQMEHNTPDTMEDFHSLQYIMLSSPRESIKERDIVWLCAAFLEISHLLLNGPDPFPLWLYPSPNSIPKTWLPHDDRKMWVRISRKIAWSRNSFAPLMGWPTIDLSKKGKQAGGFQNVWIPPAVTMGNVSILLEAFFLFQKHAK